MRPPSCGPARSAATAVAITIIAVIAILVSRGCRRRSAITALPEA
jgi:hypothetical protein